MLRWVALILLALLAYLQYTLWMRGGVHEVVILRSAVQQQIDDNAKLHQRNQALAADVADLKHGEQAVEARARSELGLIRQGEVFYQVIEKCKPTGASYPPPDVAPVSGATFPSNTCRWPAAP